MPTAHPYDPSNDDDSHDISNEVTEKTLIPPAAQLTQTPANLRDEDVVNLLERFARHLTAGEAGDIADHVFATPATVVMATQVTALVTRDDVVKMFSSAKAEYAKHGISDTRADILDIDWIGQRLALCEVRFPWLDAAGHEIGGERSTYILRRDDDDELHIQGVIMHGVEEQRAH